MALLGAKDVDRYKCHRFFAYKRARQDEVGTLGVALGAPLCRRPSLLCCRCWTSSSVPRGPRSR